MIKTVSGLRFDWYSATLQVVEKDVGDFLDIHWLATEADVYGVIREGGNGQGLGDTTRRINSYPYSAALLDWEGREVASAHWGGHNGDLHLVASGDLTDSMVKWVRALPISHKVARVDTAVDFRAPHTRYECSDPLQGTITRPDHSKAVIGDWTGLSDPFSGYPQRVGSQTGAFELIVGRVHFLLENWGADRLGLSGRAPKTTGYNLDPMSYTLGCGRSLYVGKGDVQVRVYEKGVEMLEKGRGDDLLKMGLDHPRDYVRVEVQYRPISTAKENASTATVEQLFAGPRKYTAWLAKDLLNLNLDLLERPAAIPLSPDEALDAMLQRNRRHLVSTLRGMTPEDQLARVYHALPELGTPLTGLSVKVAAERIAKSDPRKAIDKSIKDFTDRLLGFVSDLSQHQVQSVWTLLGLQVFPESLSDVEVSNSLMLPTTRNGHAARPGGVTLVQEWIKTLEKKLEDLDLAAMPFHLAVRDREPSVIQRMALRHVSGDVPEFVTAIPGFDDDADLTDVSDVLH